MTNAEKNALLNAFNIPEPERKKPFVSEYRQLLKTKTSKPNLSFIIKAVSTAAVCCLTAGIWLNVKKNADMTYDNSSHDELSIVSENTATEEKNITTTLPRHNSAVLTTSYTKSQQTQTSANSSVKNSGTSTVYAAANDRSDNEKNEIQDETASASNKSTNSSTAVSVRIAETTSRTADINNLKESTAASTTASNSIVTEEIVQNEPPSQSPVSPTAAIGGTDRTIEPDISYITSNIIPIWQIVTELPNDGIDSSGNGVVAPAPPGSAANYSWHDTAEDSECIVNGKVNRIIYTKIGGEAYTQVNILVNKVYRNDGKTAVYDRISVFFKGGYMPAREFAESKGADTDLPYDAVVPIYSENTVRPSVGNEYIMFLKSGSSSVPDGGYCFTDITDNSVYNINGDICSSRSRNISFTIQELNEFIN